MNVLVLEGEMMLVTHAGDHEAAAAVFRAVLRLCARPSNDEETVGAFLRICCLRASDPALSHAVPDSNEHFQKVFVGSLAREWIEAAQDRHLAIPESVITLCQKAFGDQLTAPAGPPVNITRGRRDMPM